MSSIIQYNAIVKITFLIPTLTNVSGLLYELKSLAKYPIIVIDNAPIKAKDFAAHNHPHCTYLPQSHNQGFARAINLGVTHVKTDWICILNDDIEFPDTLPFAKLIQVAEQNHWVAISPLLTKKTGEVENIGYRVLPMGRAEPIYDLRSTTNDQTLDGLTAACLVMKTTIFRDLGGFDGRFFAYLEDIDLFLRLKRAGHHFGVAKQIKVNHNHMTTSGGMNNFKSKMDLKNWFFVIAKNWTWHDLFINFPSIIIERLRNLSGFTKATWCSYGLRSLYIIPRDLLWILKELLIFPFKLETNRQ